MLHSSGELDADSSPENNLDAFPSYRTTRLVASTRITIKQAVDRSPNSPSHRLLISRFHPNSPLLPSTLHLPNLPFDHTQLSTAYQSYHSTLLATPMSFLSLPPEILLLVTSFTIISPSRDRQTYRKRQNTLHRLSLVHRSWTSIAQDALRKEIWTRRWERGESHRLAGRNVYGTEYLMIDVSLRHLPNGTGSGKWDRVKYLELFGVLDDFRGELDGGDSDEEYGSNDERLKIGCLTAFPRM